VSEVYNNSSVGYLPAARLDTFNPPLPVLSLEPQAGSGQAPVEPVLLL